MNIDEAIVRESSPAANRRWVNLLRTQETPDNRSYVAAVEPTGRKGQRESQRHLAERRAAS